MTNENTLSKLIDMRLSVKSNGLEDLRHGWYCFREQSQVNLDIPWFQREETFNEAIPFVDAFYWCTHFEYSDKEY